MPWVLIGVGKATAGQKRWLSPGFVYKVGTNERNCIAITRPPLSGELVAKFEEKIVNLIATIHVQGMYDGLINDVDKKLNVYIRDEGSQQRAFINGTKMNQDNDQKVLLKHQDLINFGCEEYSYQLFYECILVCLSLSSQEKLSQCEQWCMEADIKLTIGKWKASQSTHLCMDNVWLCPLSISAMVECRPIVTPQWLEQLAWKCNSCLMEAIFELPNERKYLPNSDEIIDKRFVVKESRKSLFEGFVFISFHEQKFLDQYISFCGGKLQQHIYGQNGINNLQDIEDAIKRVQREYRDPLVLEPPNPELKATVVKAARNTVNARLIKPTEISYAIYNGNTRSYCNPYCEPTVRKVSVNFTIVKCLPNKSLSWDVYSSQKLEAAQPSIDPQHLEMPADAQGDDMDLDAKDCVIIPATSVSISGAVSIDDPFIDPNPALNVFSIKRRSLQENNNSCSKLMKETLSNSHNTPNSKKPQNSNVFSTRHIPQFIIPPSPPFSMNDVPGSVITPSLPGPPTPQKTSTVNYKKFKKASTSPTQPIRIIPSVYYDQDSTHNCKHG